MTTYKILTKGHDDESPHEASPHHAGDQPCSHIQSYDEAICRASDWLRASYPDWDDSVIVTDERTGKHCHSITLTLVHKDLRNE